MCFKHQHITRFELHFGTSCIISSALTCGYFHNKISTLFQVQDVAGDFFLFKGSVWTVCVSIMLLFGEKSVSVASSTLKNSAPNYCSVLAAIRSGFNCFDSDSLALAFLNFEMSNKKIEFISITKPCISSIFHSSTASTTHRASISYSHKKRTPRIVHSKICQRFKEQINSL